MRQPVEDTTHEYSMTLSLFNLLKHLCLGPPKFSDENLPQFLRASCDALHDAGGVRFFVDKGTKKTVSPLVMLFGACKLKGNDEEFRANVAQKLVHFIEAGPASNSRQSSASEDIRETFNLVISGFALQSCSLSTLVMHWVTRNIEVKSRCDEVATKNLCSFVKEIIGQSRENSSTEATTLLVDSTISF